MLSPIVLNRLNVKSYNKNENMRLYQHHISTHGTHC